MFIHFSNPIHIALHNLHSLHNLSRVECSLTRLLPLLFSLRSRSNIYIHVLPTLFYNFPLIISETWQFKDEFRIEKEVMHERIPLNVMHFLFECFVEWAQHVDGNWLGCIGS